MNGKANVMTSHGVVNLIFRSAVINFLTRNRNGDKNTSVVAFELVVELDIKRKKGLRLKSWG